MVTITYFLHILSSFYYIFCTPCITFFYIILTHAPISTLVGSGVYSWFALQHTLIVRDQTSDPQLEDDQQAFRHNSPQCNVIITFVTKLLAYYSFTVIYCNLLICCIINCTMNLKLFQMFGFMLYFWIIEVCVAVRVTSGLTSFLWSLPMTLHIDSFPGGLRSNSQISLCVY